MKTIAKYRVLVITTMLVFTLTGVTTAQKRGSNHNRNDHKKEVHKPVKVEVKHNSNAYKYKNYNYTDYHGRTIYTRHNPVVVYRHNKVPVRYTPHLVVNKPGAIVAMHLDGVKYFVDNGRFFRHYPNRGFVMVNRPAYVKHLPAGVVKVRLNGRFYFKYHNVYFEWTPLGYRIV